MTGLMRQLRPTIDTKFHIDYSWWENQERELNVYLMSLLPQEKRDYLEAQAELEVVDWIDPETAEVRRVNPFERAIRDTADEIDLSKTSLVDAVFRVFLLNNNTPLTARDLGQLIGRPADTILRTIGTTNRVYRGIRFILEDN